MKICFKCNYEKPLSEFYKHKMMGDGYLGKCKECAKKDAKTNRKNNLLYYQEYDRNRANILKRKDARAYYAKTEHGKKALKSGRADYLDRHPLKRSTHIKFGNALRDKKIIPLPCEACGAIPAQGHHDDYSKPFDVRWLCVKHHNEHHNNERQKARGKS